MDVSTTALLRYLAGKSPQLMARAELVADRVKTWLEYVPATFPHYTSHTISHSEAVIEQLSLLLFADADPSRPSVQLSAVEVYLLVACAYLHDAGMVVPDTEKTKILGSEEWKAWVEVGDPQLRYRKIEELRNGAEPSDPDVRHFLADRQLRFLIADFVRRTHHDRSQRVVDDLSDLLGSPDLGDNQLRRTIGDVCAGHGLDRAALEDEVRYPDRRNLLGEEVNVRLVAILLRIADLLDMSEDRACPLAMQAASPLPTDSIAHWTKYERIADRLVAPDEIRLRVECQTQDEHRFFEDWCQWLVDEVASAAVAVPRLHRHSGWRPPTTTMSGPNPTIVIVPARTARYIPRDWKMELDPQMVFERLVRDVYPEPHAFLRELVQNALDATRCRLYEDLRSSGDSAPADPTSVAQAMRFALPIRVDLRWVEVENELSGLRESRQELSVEDRGIGMDEEIITRYLLQVGRSYYATPQFVRRYNFTPTSRFGVGFLSVFADSDHVLVETYRPSSAGAAPISLLLTGPRQYILTERGDRNEAGTLIKVRLRSPMEPGELTSIIRRWCKRVEFPIVVDDMGSVTTIEAEEPEDFLAEEAEVDGSRFFIRYFPVNANAVHGEIYIFAAEDSEGETWVSGPWAHSGYLDQHPTARVPSVPPNLICLGGIAISESPAYPQSMSSRIDYRGQVELPTLGRSIQQGHRARQPWNEAVWNELRRVIDDHLATTARAQGNRSFLYRQRLESQFEFPDYWESVPGLVRYWAHGRETLASIREVAALPSFTVSRTVSRESHLSGQPAPEPAPLDSLATIVEEDGAHLSDRMRAALFGIKRPTAVRVDGASWGVEWASSAEPNQCQETLWSIGSIAVVDLGQRRLLGIRCLDFRQYEGPVLLNANHPLTAWFLGAVSQRGSSDEALTRIVKLVPPAIKYGYDNLRLLLAAIDDWRASGLDPAPPEVDANEIDNSFGRNLVFRD
jgi:molecular chaperone HtpG